MNHESINRQTRRVVDVHRAEAYLGSLTDEEIDRLLNERQQNVSLRWAECRKKFRMLFMALNRENGRNLPRDTFDIRLNSEIIGNDTVDTYARIRRNRKDDSYDVRPFTRNGRIEDHEFEGEQFSGTYTYRYGTYYSKSAKLSVDHDEPEPVIKLERINGYIAAPDNIKNKAALLAAIDGLVSPSLENIEETLNIIVQAALDSQLNPDLVDRLRLEH
jgi:hypothetical protein